MVTWLAIIIVLFLYLSRSLSSSTNQDEDSVSTDSVQSKSPIPLFNGSVHSQYIGNNQGELSTHAELTRLDPGKYKIYSPLYVPIQGKVTQIDHVILSMNGLFVLEVKGHRGSIYGAHKDREWKVYYKGGKEHELQNPISQNEYHRKALIKYLNIPSTHIISLIYFPNAYSLKVATTMPLLERGDLLGEIRKYSVPIFTPVTFGHLECELDKLMRNQDKLQEIHTDSIQQSEHTGSHASPVIRLRKTRYHV
jgi:hypothetical protein